MDNHNSMDKHDDKKNTLKQSNQINNSTSLLNIE